MQRRIRLGIVGLGYGRYGFVPAFRHDPRCDIVAICATSIARANEVAKDLQIPYAFADYRVMIEECDLEAIAIAVPPTIQPDIATAAFESSIAVFGEKPIAGSLEAARSLCEVAARAKVPNMIDFIFPEIEAWEHARELIQTSAIGSVRHLVVEWVMESSDIRLGIKTWKTDSSLGGGVLQHFASHTLYYLEWFLGPLKDLSACLSRAPDVSRPGDNLAVLSANCISGASASVTVCNSAVLGSGHRLEFYGDAGALVLSNTTNSPARGFRILLGKRGDQELKEVPVVERLLLPDSIDTRVAPLSREATRFLDWIETGTPTKPTFQDGLRVQHLLDAAIRSNEMQSRIRV